MQHLREASDQQVSWEQAPAKEEKPRTKLNEGAQIERINKLNLPKNVFASEKEEKVGLLNKAAPQGLNLNLDPDIVEAMDEDFDFDDPDNQLEDNFIELANAVNSDEDEMDDEDVSSDMGGYSSEEQDEVPSLNGSEHTFDHEETKSRFTEYSMSSSVMRRNNQLTLVDERFEKMFADYDDNEIGALDTDEIEGFVDPNSDLLMQCADEFEKMKARKQLENEAIQLRAKLLLEEPPSDEEKEELRNLDITEKPEAKWDCESILSTYSNLYNHPKLISEPKGERKIRINPKTGIPMNVLNNSNKLTAKTLAQFDLEQNKSLPKGPQSCAESVLSRLSVLSIRNKDESPEEKKNRKHLLKEYRRERRLEKKANAEAFKEEKKRQEKILLNNKNNVQGIK